MAWQFGDGFDLYAAPADMVNGYWDSFANLTTLVAGRFSGSQAIRFSAANMTATRTSGINDAVHHIVVAFQQTAVITGTTLGTYFQLLDGTTGQCCIVFRSDGAILLTSGTAAGTVLDTYTGAFPVTNTWYAFEFEVVINNTTGSWAVRKNGNSVNDRALGSLNTRGGTVNNYANKLTLNMQATVNAQLIDDLFWRSDAASVPWMGDIRCYTRMPASDASVTFSRTPTSNVQSNTGTTTTRAVTNTVAQFTLYTVAFDGVISSAVVVSSTGVSGNMKCAIYSSVGGVPIAVLGSSGPQVAVAAGNNTFTFTPSVAVTKGQQVWVAAIVDTSGGSLSTISATTNGATATMSYASFPTASPTATTGISSPQGSITYNTGTNAGVVNEAQQDATTSYVYDSTPGDQDFYGIAAIASTPVATIAVTTRGYMEKSDAGTRTAAVQLKSGSTTVASSTLVLTTSGWQWAWRMDLTDPNTSAAWTPAAVNNAQVGPKVIA